MRKKKPAKQSETVEIYEHIHNENDPKPLVCPENKPSLTYMVPQIPVYFPSNMRPAFFMPKITCLGI